MKNSLNNVVPDERQISGFSKYPAKHSTPFSLSFRTVSVGIQYYEEEANREGTIVSGLLTDAMLASLLSTYEGKPVEYPRSTLLKKSVELLTSANQEGFQSLTERVVGVPATVSSSAFEEEYLSACDAVAKNVLQQEGGGSKKKTAKGKGRPGLLAINAVLQKYFKSYLGDPSIGKKGYASLLMFYLTVVRQERIPFYALFRLHHLLVRPFVRAGRKERFDVVSTFREETVLRSMFCHPVVPGYSGNIGGFRVYFRAPSTKNGTPKDDAFLSAMELIIGTAKKSDNETTDDSGR